MNRSSKLMEGSNLLHAILEGTTIASRCNYRSWQLAKCVVIFCKVGFFYKNNKFS